MRTVAFITRVFNPQDINFERLWVSWVKEALIKRYDLSNSGIKYMLKGLIRKKSCLVTADFIPMQEPCELHRRLKICFCVFVSIPHVWFCFWYKRNVKVKVFVKSLRSNSATCWWNNMKETWHEINPSTPQYHHRFIKWLCTIQMKNKIKNTEMEYIG